MTDVPATMRAFVLTGHGDIDKLVYHPHWPVPQPGPEEVLIRVHACGLNNTDINTRTGWYSSGVTQGTTAEGGRGGFAEGVEEEAQANRLIEFGCASGQGFLFGRPSDAGSTLDYLRSMASTRLH